MNAPKLDSGAALGFFWDVFKARPTTFIGLGVWTSLVFAAVGVAQVYVSADEMAALEAADPEDVTAVFSSMGAYLGAIAPVMLVSFAVTVLIESAWLRLFMRGEGNPVLPFRFGAEEGNYLLTFLLLALVTFVVYLVGLIVMLVFTFVFALGGAALGSVGLFLGSMVALAIVIFALVRLSPALAFAISRKRVSLGLAWRGTKVMFWPLLGCYVLAFLISMVIFTVTMIVFLFLPFDMSGLDASRQPVGWEALIVPFLLLNAANLIPQALFRGIACKAALTIEEANGVPPAASQTVGPV